MNIQFTNLFNVEFVPTGHFYSAVPSIETRTDYACSWEERRLVKSLPGITIDEEAEQAHLDRIATTARSCSFPQHKTEGWRYYFENPAYSYGDSLSLHAMLLHLKPKQVIEVGSGYSSAMMLDTNEKWLSGSTALTFIEPYPDLLKSLFKNEDYQKHTIREEGVQETPLDLFLSLEADDILFIDSTHVSKLGSDVNRLFLEIIPALHPGVCVHVHDICWPFNYPPQWLQEGRAWNEAYLLQALLQHNTRYKIEYFSDHALRTRTDWVAKEAPLLERNPGAHIWFKINK